MTGHAVVFAPHFVIDVVPLEDVAVPPIAVPDVAVPAVAGAEPEAAVLCSVQPAEIRLVHACVPSICPPVSVTVAVTLPLASVREQTCWGVSGLVGAPFSIHSTPPSALVLIQFAHAGDTSSESDWNTTCTSAPRSVTVHEVGDEDDGIVYCDTFCPAALVVTLALVELLTVTVPPHPASSSPPASASRDKTHHVRVTGTSSPRSASHYKRTDLQECPPGLLNPDPTAPC